MFYRICFFNLFFVHFNKKRNRGSTLSRVTAVRSLTGAEDFFSTLFVQTSSRAHPAPSREVKWGRSVTLTTYPYLVSWLRNSRSYTLSPPKRLRDVYWDSFSLLYILASFILLGIPCAVSARRGGIKFQTRPIIKISYKIIKSPVHTNNNNSVGPRHLILWGAGKL